MTSALQLPGLAGVSYEQLDTDINARDISFARELIARLAAPLPTERPSEWIEANIIFDEPQIKGPFTFKGREYLRQPIDDNADEDIHDQDMIFGTGTGKTISYMAGQGWAMIHEPFRGIWVMPTTIGAGGARNFNKTRFSKMLEATRVLSEKIPVGADRYNFTGLHIEMAGNVIDFVGSNSPGQMASNRCRRVHKDEVDKFKASLGNEAGAIYLADERTKGVSGAKRFSSTTPTVDTAPGWQSLMTSDLRRRFLPCPHCNSQLVNNNRFVLAWSEQYTVLPNKLPDGSAIATAQMRWDKQAKRTDGTWDVARVIQSARFECPHCGGHLEDKHRQWMDKNGQWKPTRNGSPHHVGYHLPSYYIAWIDRDFDSSFGGMAKKFLDATETGAGMRGWINSEAAEVDVTQEHGRNQITISTTPNASGNWIPLMTVDVQKLWPYLWFAIRKWSSFKLHPPFALVGGRPSILPHLTEHLKRQCELVVAGHEPAWLPLAELLRFDPRTGEFPLLDFCIARNITGQNLVNLYHRVCETDALALGRYLYRESGQRMPKGGDSELIAAGHCSTGDWAELRELAQQYKVGQGLGYPGLAVCVDAGYAEKNNPEVLRNCFETGKKFAYYDPFTKGLYEKPIHNQCKPCPLDNWQPFKGYPIKKRWNIHGITREWHYGYHDPMMGTSEADRRVIRVLEAASDLFWEEMTELRDKQTAAAIQRGGNLWTIATNAMWLPEDKFKQADYQIHMDARYRDREGNVKDRGTGSSGMKRWPDHLNDCERNQFALAKSLGFFSYETA